MIEWTHVAPRSPVASGPGAPDGGLASAPLTAFLEAARLDREPLLIVVNDPTRSTATAPALRAIATAAPDALGRARVLVATGSHSFGQADRAAYERALELPTFGVSSVSWHDALDASLVDVGGFRGHPWLAEARRVLAIGSVEPHYFAGLTGAHKTITIGCIGRRDIEHNHERALDPATRILTLDGNPVFDGIADMATRIASTRNVIAINQIVHDGELVHAEVGDPLATVRSLRARVIELYAHVLGDTFDVLHLRVPSPLGRSFYQADKALKNHDLAVRDGGAIILEAACEEGLGQRAFIDLLEAAPSLERALALVAERGYRLGDHKAVLLRRLMDEKCRGVRVHLVSPLLPPSALDRTGITVHRSFDAALEAAAAGGGHLRGLRVDDAAMCVSLHERAVPAGAADAR